MEKKMLAIPIILVFYNQEAWTSVCINSLRKHTKEKDYKLIVIDNGSTLKISERIKKTIKDNEIFYRISEPATMSFVYNYAVSQYTNENDKYFVILHNDVVLTDNWLDNLVNIAEAVQKSSNEFSVIYPRTVCSTEGTPIKYDDKLFKKFVKSKRNNKEFVDESIILSDIKKSYSGYGGLDGHAKKIHNENAGKYSVCEEGSLFCTLFDRKMFMSIGGFDKSFSVYGSEIKSYNEEAMIDYAAYSILSLDTFVHHQCNITSDGPGRDFRSDFESSHNSFLRVSESKRLERLSRKKFITALSSGDISILAIRNTGIGDIIMSMFVLSGIKKKYPKSQISYMTHPNFMEFVKRFKCVDHVLPMKLSFNAAKANKENIMALSEPYADKFDIIYNWVAYLELFDVSDTHRLDKFLNSINIKGIEPICPEYQILPEDEKWIGKNIPESSFERICVAPSGSCEIRSISVDLCSQIIDKESKNKQIILIDQDPDRCGKILEKVKKKKNVVDLSGKVKIEQLPAIIKSCKYIYTPDSGQFHIAGIMGTKCIAFFGSIDPFLRDGQYPLSKENKIFYKKELPCVPCKDVGCEDVMCMQYTTKDIIS